MSEEKRFFDEALMPPSLIMLAYRWWLIPVSDAGVITEDNDGALCAGRE